MPAFHVTKVYFWFHKDQIVLAGQAEEASPMPGWEIELPASIKGPGWVPVQDVQIVPFDDGVEALCVVIGYASIEPAPFMEFSDLEGLTLSVRRGS